MRNLVRALIAALSLAALPIVSQAGLFVGVSVNIPPPALPVYVQPPCPAPGYIWIPGYWAWDDDYYWVPGTWALAPAVGLLWTPGYWGWGDGAYLWHAGYWGPHVGFYGGINYGFGYSGVGYEGGYWRGREFYYNRSVTNINTNITHVYNRTVINNVNVTRVSFNGGAGGVMARPTRAQVSAEHERRLGLTPVQRQQEQQAHADPALRAAVNGGRPAIAATPRAGEFGHGAGARGAEHGGALFAARGAEHNSGASRANEGRAAPEANVPRFDRPATVQHAPPEARANGPIEQRPAARVPQYTSRPPEHQMGNLQGQPRPAPQYQPRPATQYQPRPATQYQPHPAPQYQGRPQPQSPPRPEPRYQPRSAPQAPGHAGQEAPRPEHGGEHNRQG